MSLTDKELIRSYRFTLGAFVFGSVATLGINLAHAESGWGPKLTSIIAPISVLFVVEMFLHAPKPSDPRIGRLLQIIIGAIGFSALTISYVHTADLLMSYGEAALLAWLMPMVPDGMMAASSIYLALTMREREKRAGEQELLEAEMQRKAEIAERRRSTIASKKAAPAAKVAPKTTKSASAKVSTPSAKELQLQAQSVYRESLDAGKPLSAVALAEKFDRKETWGRTQIRLVQESLVPDNAESLQLVSA